MAKKPEAGPKYLQVEVGKIVPNDWNPNSLPPEYQGRLQNGIVRLLERTGTIPPIVVRPHPKVSGSYEIIDGYHRWMVIKKLKKPNIDAFVLDVDDAQARLLTDTLNYLRGEPDEGKRGKMLSEILSYDKSLTVEDLEKLIPKDADQIIDIISAADIDLNVLDEVLSRTNKPEDGDEPEEERWVALNFNVPSSVAAIVERELDRLAGVLTGKQRRMRALEYMAVNSSFCSLDDVAKKASEDAARAAVPTKDQPSKLDILKEKAKAKAQRKGAA